MSERNYTVGVIVSFQHMVTSMSDNLRHVLDRCPDQCETAYTELREALRALDKAAKHLQNARGWEISVLEAEKAEK